MSDTHIQGLVKKQTLSEAEANAIEQLITLCNSYEGLHMRLDVGALRQRPGNETDDFLYYEDGILVGYLFVEDWGSRDTELAGMVHSNFRRRGIFSSLLAAAKEECQQRNAQKLILVCEHFSKSGLAFVHAIGAHHEYRELGYGRQILEEAIRIIRSESHKRVMLDVETDNDNAIGLYLSCGFEIKTTYDYCGLIIS